MADSLQSTLHTHLVENDWTPNRQYSALTTAVQDVINFAVRPSASLAVSRSISNCLKRHWSVGIPLTGSVGYTLAESGPDVDHPFLVYGKLFPGRLEYLYTQRVAKSMQTQISGINHNDKNRSYIAGKVQWAQDSFFSELNLNSRSGLVGISSLASLYNWSLGGELYYTASEKLGGFSFGLRRFSRSTEPKPSIAHPCATSDLELEPTLESVSTATINPPMGYLSASYSARIPLSRTRLILGSARFDYNVFSLASDLCIGLKHVTDTGAFRLRCGFAEGVAVMYEYFRDSLKVSLGVMTELTGSTPRKGLSLEIQLEMR